MHKFFTLFFLFTISIVCGQSISGTVTYDIEMVKNLLEETKFDNSRVKHIVMSQQEALKNALRGERPIFRLDFNERVAIFKALPRMDNEAQKTDLTLIGIDEIYYTNRKGNFLFKKVQIFGQLYRVKSSFSDYDWKISSESKKIAGYLCYKALLQIPKGDRMITIEAWFTPSVPYGYGPIEYGGLPGLILELNKLGFRYRAIKLKLSEKYKEIKIPTEGKIINQEELNAKISQYMEKISR